MRISLLEDLSSEDEYELIVATDWSDLLIVLLLLLLWLPINVDLVMSFLHDLDSEIVKFTS